jgi:glycosyltransferase involved in cell wall biosynthesis
MQKRALVVYTHPSTFVKGDVEILRQNFRVEEYRFTNNPPGRLPISLVIQKIFLLFTIYRFDLVYIWFADYHSFLPTLVSHLAGKHCVLVIGGYDVCREKKYRYGSLSKPLRAFMAISSMKMASDVLCVSANIARIVGTIAPKANKHVVYNGIRLPLPGDAKAFDEQDNQQPAYGNRSVLCVALASTLQSFYIKGIDRYNKVASKIPDTCFTLVGCTKQVFELAGIEPAKNLRIIPPIPHDQLYTLYSQSHVYCQFSRRESFSLSLAEAMYHQMIPVISTAGGMPEVTSGLGYTVYFNDSPQLCDQSIENAITAINQALNEPKHPTYQHHINQHFTLTTRAHQLAAVASLG